MTFAKPHMLPYSFEDRTGSTTNSDFDDIYDRMFFHVMRQPGRSTTYIYEMPIRASHHRSLLPLNREPSVILEFLPDESLGNVTFVGKGHFTATTIPMVRYLRKTSLFGTSLTRKFVGSDGREYKWSHQSGEGQQWTCTTPENYLVAHYDLKPPNVKTLDVTGNTLTIYEPFAHLALELMASFIIMRHVAEHHL
ncbi:hypothetical protein AGABI1DRAFT_116578 [Agaricus bisporus var. burnettii JB137-S8]|uniref:DUF6593 domain-containing protein n=1 Tax=Agaricus bisporus var. burnettii (strain JB137-S8 / ATCC MYA-4627 / FGSC 10392) TaxID=597362 RepID=K5XKS2_AGABU|nr:uncharacterized protein AGABI1DRAFT_116578 [Agaricus bisporus var. burnettii JB137-S8]EKM75080.1 hypothetical protein AGABI1DRAFT_116578 [Agaricus bisporus var. burnettii JB137-S8]